ncbi:MAG: NUDIX domain-containing protein [Proteobacteria bacterium]|nr:NUDIX domain-containing protein [Pseudomonadota bacterium]
MTAHCKLPVDLHLIVRRGDDVLLGLRQNTGYADGHYHVPAGHLDPGESFTEGVAREALEELGIVAPQRDIVGLLFMDHLSDSRRTALFFDIRNWTGEIRNAEPHKCERLDWFPIGALPSNTVPYAAVALNAIRNGMTYVEFRSA